MSCDSERSRGFSGPTRLDASTRDERREFRGTLGDRNSADSQLEKRAAQLAERRRGF